MYLERFLERGFTRHFGDAQFISNLINSACQGACQRQLQLASWERSRIEWEAAERSNQPLTPPEWDMALRKEDLEWEVRDAILNLWSKGYTTTRSGYSEASHGLHFLYLLSVRPPPNEILKKVWRLTDTTKIPTWAFPSDWIKENYYCAEYGSKKPLFGWLIQFLYTGDNPNVIKSQWDLIAQQLPDLGWLRLVKRTQYADNFRKRHTLL